MTKKYTVATAYLAFLPETSSLDKGLRKSISGVQKSISQNSSKIKKAALKPVSEGIDDGAKSGSRSAVRTVSSSLGRGVSSAISGAVKKGFSGAGKVASVAGKAISKTLKGAAVTAGGSIAGVLGVSITKGVGRLQAIDQATAKLSGLGHAADSVKAIMEDATAAVKGTAFGLDEAASAAAGTVAAGVKPGKDLQRTLKLVGDAAAIAGTDLSSMGAIFNKVASSNKMQMDVANQLMDQGIPIMQLVGKQMGVTAEEAVKMASKGEISFDIFQKAIEDGMGGAALKSGETFKGAMDNAGAAMGRFGATLAEPAFQNAPTLFGALTDVFDQLDEKTKPLAARFGEELQPKVEEFSRYISEDLVDDVSSGVSTVIEEFGKMKEAASGLAASAGSHISGIYEKIKPGALNIYDTAQDGTGKIVSQAGEVHDEIRKTVSELDRLKNGLSPVFDHIEKRVNILTRMFSDPIHSVDTSKYEDPSITPQNESGLKSFVDAAITPQMIEKINGQISDMFNSLQVTLLWLKENVTPIFDAMASRIEPTIEYFGHIFTGLRDIFRDEILPLFNGDGEDKGPLTKAFEAISQSVGPLIDGFNAIIPPLAKILMELLRPIAGIISDTIALLAEIFAAILPPLSNALGAMMEKIGGVLESIGKWMEENRTTVEFLVNAFFILRGLAVAFIRGIVGAGPKTAAAFNDMRGAAVNALRGVWNSFKGFFTNIKSHAIDAFRGIRELPGWFRRLPGVAKSEFQKIVDTIKNLWKTVEDILKNPFKNLSKIMDGLSFGSIFANRDGGGESFSRGGVLSGGTSRTGDDRHYLSLTGHGLLSLRSGEAIMVDSFVSDIGGKSAIEKINRASRLGQPYAFSTDGYFDGNSTGSVVEIKVGSDFISVSDLERILSQLRLHGQQIKIIQDGQGSSALTSYLARK